MYTTLLINMSLWALSRCYLNNVTNIDNEGTRGGLDPDPFTIRFSPNFKPSDPILGKDGQGSSILVSTHTEGQLRGRTRWVVVESNEAGVVLEEAIEAIRRKP